ncbi:MAG: precorrin-6y C5,15-methyltransferase (decarboxylating) subunit CbiE [Desulfobacterales bacterium]|nr:precorrin-6y C5,15-methyltransferase (decarboxylating) subunit CbiE [Desulfobacterales bacterium]
MSELADQPVNVIGMGMSPRDLTAIHLDIIAAAEVLVGGRRHLACFPDSTARRIEIDRNLTAVVEQIKREMGSKRVVVLASGDPLYFGIGAYLLKALGSRHLHIWPNINAVAAAFARIGRSWHDVVVVSLHGRQNENQLIHALQVSTCLAVFTDQHHTPAWLAEVVAAHGHPQMRLCILERLGSDDESLRWLAPKDAALENFHEPNLVVIETGLEEARCRPFLGLPDEQIAHERSLITKSEVRAVALSKLEIRPGMVLWDLGAGSGAVAIEGACLVGEGSVWAVEKDAGRIAQIRENCRQWGAGSVHVIEAQLPAGMEDLPAPDRVFIGGGGRALAAIVTTAAHRLNSGGILVVNAVLIGSMHTAVQTMRNAGLQTDFTQVQISRSRTMPAGDRMEALNPVWIVRGHKIS